MLKKNLKKPITAIIVVASILFSVFAASSNLVNASGGSIAMANAYPQEGCTYLAIDHFTYQLSAVNTNTTVLVSIDGGPLVSMTFQGIRDEAVNGDTVARDWYTWQAMIPPITDPGNHTFQFFSHYYVWQDTDEYWGEFNARSTIYSFTITSTFSTQATLTPTTTHITPHMQPIQELQLWIILSFVAAAILSIAVVRKRILKK
jgi:hypothetical protein